MPTDRDVTIAVLALIAAQGEELFFDLHAKAKFIWVTDAACFTR